MDDAPAGFRIALAGGRVLGNLKMGDVASVNGRPATTDYLTGENAAIYAYIHRSGPEGSEKLTFSFATTFRSPDDPGGFNSAMEVKRVTGFTVSR